MIARMWSGVTPAARADAYHEYLEATGVPGLTETPGNRGVYIFRRIADDEAHFTMISLWDSLEQIKAFAGDDISVARFYPEDDDFMTRYEKTVTHFEVLGFHPGRSSE